MHIPVKNESYMLYFNNMAHFKIIANTWKPYLNEGVPRWDRMIYDIFFSSARIISETFTFDLPPYKYMHMGLFWLFLLNLYHKRQLRFNQYVLRYEK